MSPVSPKIASLFSRPRLQLRTGYFGDLVDIATPGSTAVAGLFDNLVVGVGTKVADRRQRLEPVGRQLQ